MDRRFTFDAGSSDEEQPPSDYQSSSEEEEEEELPSSSAAAGNHTKSKKKSQSPWEFSTYSESVAEEHLRRNTTSVDDKIHRARVENKIETHVDSDDENTDDVDEREGFELEEEEREDRGNEAAAFFSSSEGASFHADSFLELNLSRPLLKACDALGYKKPTPIQAACVPLALAGRDISGSAITGSGKTAAFGLPILERLLFRPKRVNAIRVLVLTPTRELAVQVHSMIEKLAQFTDIRCCLVAGGLSLKMQEAALRSRPDIVVATPGRMIDHLRNSQSVGLEDLAVLILDEADRLLELNFSAEIRELVDLCPKQRQTMLFSATMTDEVNELIKLSLNKPVRLSADPSTKRPSALIEEVIRIRPTREANQEAVLLSLCSRNFKTKVIIFSGTKKEAHRLKILFGLSGLKAAELHADLTQAQRLDALEIFRKGEVDFLCATDVAARGLDIVGVQTVINFTCPQNITSYVHRVGRTARAGKEGYAITFVTERDRSLLKAIVKRAGSKLLSRTVAQASVVKWSQRIEEMEDQVAAIIEEERTEKILRKAEMEAAKAENMIEHKLEIFSRPRRTWFETEKEKKAAAVAAKVSKENSLDVKNLTKSVEQADKEEKKERKRHVIEKNLPRKKRRRLEAEREMLRDEFQDNGDEKKVRGEKSLVDLGYRQAKSIKSKMKAQQSGKVLKKRSKDGRAPSRIQSRKKEIQELFEGERSLKKDMRGSTTVKKKVPKSSFKSKSRYKRRK